MELVVNKNTYFTVEEADALVSSHLLSMSDEAKFWNSLSENDKTVLIITGTEIFEKLHFIGKKKDIDQTMQFPRLYRDETVEINDGLKFGILKNLIVKYSDQGTKESKLMNQGVKKYSVEGASIEFHSKSDRETKILKNGISKEVYDEYFVNYIW